MTRRRVVLTAGFDKALHVLTLGELLRRDGHEIAGVLVVTPYRLRRIRSLTRTRGPGFARTAAQRLLGKRTSAREHPDPLLEFRLAHGVGDVSIRRWTEQHAIPRWGIPDLNSKAAIERVKRAAVDVVIYGGGGILKAKFLEACGGRVLNAHAGPIPAIRGMNAVEWTVLLGLDPEVTVHLIDEGIDTGRSLVRIPVSVGPTDSLDSLRARAIVTGVQALRETVPSFDGSAFVEPSAPPKRLTRQCFVLAPILRELATIKLAQRDWERSESS